MIYTTAANTYATASLTAFARTLLDDADATTARATLGLTIGTNVQAYDSGLNAIAALAVTNGNFIVGNGTTWVAESGATARASLGLGSLATLSAINNANWSGTDLAVANGGTGASDAATARTNLGLGGLAVLDFSDLGYTGTSSTNTSFPIGETLVVSAGAGINRNASSAIYLYTGNSVQYTTNSAGSQVSGTWRARGLCGGDVMLMRRTA